MMVIQISHSGNILILQLQALRKCVIIEIIVYSIGVYIMGNNIIDLRNDTSHVYNAVCAIATEHYKSHRANAPDLCLSVQEINKLATVDVKGIKTALLIGNSALEHQASAYVKSGIHNILLTDISLPLLEYMQELQSLFISSPLIQSMEDVRDFEQRYHSFIAMHGKICTDSPIDSQAATSTEARILARQCLESHNNNIFASVHSLSAAIKAYKKLSIQYLAVDWSNHEDIVSLAKHINTDSRKLSIVYVNLSNILDIFTGCLIRQDAPQLREMGCSPLLSHLDVIPTDSNAIIRLVTLRPQVFYRESHRAFYFSSFKEMIAESLDSSIKIFAQCLEGKDRMSKKIFYNTIILGMPSSLLTRGTMTNADITITKSLLTEAVEFFQDHPSEAIGLLGPREIKQNVTTEFIKALSELTPSLEDTMNIDISCTTTCSLSK